MIIQCTIRYRVFLWRGRVFILLCHFRCLASWKASITSVFRWLFRYWPCPIHGTWPSWLLPVYLQWRQDPHS